MLTIIGGLILVVAVVAFVLHPVVAGKSATLTRVQDEPTEAEARKRVALLALRDVEYDFATGKLDEADYSALREELASEAIEALAAEEAEREGPAKGIEPSEARHPGAVELEELEREIEAYRQELGEALPCERCGHLNETEARFCASCGARLTGLEPAGRP